ncbi:adhesion G-protein coupled receptor D1 isoform 1-T1 [Clarias gariepinus]|uniref:adhesion G-protein coupled receptor D1 isoform X2 n=1 Tax=Clarias gariepinus TaxID=13013 RepID=UPI00234D6975|nr:adhesion G-protein coupled receptor D1 isoform X2 [Clarias gariepinus]
MGFLYKVLNLSTFVSILQVLGDKAAPSKHSGLDVLATASHYWSLDDVDGIYSLREQIINRTDIVEGVLNKGIYLNRAKGDTFLHFGTFKNSCISDPSLCGPQGITFSFFWKNQKSHSNFTIMKGKIVSNGFSVYTDSRGGYVEFFTKENTRRWKAKINLPGPFWTNILFTWTLTDGLKIYVNGTFNASDAQGDVSQNYADANANMVIGSGPNTSNRQSVPVTFNEFVIWERALSAKEIWLFYNAAIGKHVVYPPTTGSPSFINTTTGAPLQETTTSLHITTSNSTEIQDSSVQMSVQGVLQSSFILPNKTIPESTAYNLTQSFLKSVDEVISLRGDVEPSTPVVSGLIDTVDKVMGHMVSNLKAEPSSVVTVGGKSYVADYSLMKFPQNYNMQNYRFPTQGKNYISVPGEAFTTESQTTIVGLFYHSMHNYYKQISPLRTRINEAVEFKDHKIQVASHLISLKVEPSPALSVNLSSEPLIRIMLTHQLSKEQQLQAINESNKVFLYCAFLDYSTKEGVWSNNGCKRAGGNLTYSVCVCNHLTNFAILMQVVPVELAKSHQVALSTITYVGCSISIFCLAITLVTFAVLSSVSTIRNQRYHIHANLSFAILVAQILLLISFRFEPGTLPCKVMAVLLHFFFLCAFAWMLVEGLHLYSMVIKVFGSEGSKHFYYYGIGWGSPVVICVVSITSSLSSYGEDGNCWLSLKNGAIWAFVAPALFVILVNIGILIAVTRIISRISAENYKVHGDANSVKLTAKAVAVLLPILGISWIFGVLAVNDQSFLFQYMFAVFNSLQGFFIFLFHCLLNSEVRAAFKHKTKVWSLTSSSIRNINVKPFNSDIMNGNRGGASPTRMNTWDKSTNSANRIDLSAV